ncbi:MAG: plastocyanin/azurin family copper-binding protein [Candidatus Kariarchaeaceae archaeon]|jgi:plastocyanin
MQKNQLLLIILLIGLLGLDLPAVIKGQDNPKFEVHLLGTSDLTFNLTEIVVPNGAQVTIFMRSEMTAHTFTIKSDKINFDETDTEGFLDLVVLAGQVRNITFTVPDEDTEIRFFCRPHENDKMEGKIIVGEGIVEDNNDSTLPGFQLLFFVIAIIPLIRLRKKY